MLLAPLAFALGLTLLAPVPARHRRPRVTYEDPRDRRPSATYAAMGKAACLRELGARKIPFSKVEKAPGVIVPVRLTGPVAGVTYRTDAPDFERAQSPAEVFDCRLVLALADLSKLLVARGIDEVRIASAWRPSKRARPGKQGNRHAGGLAVDLMRFGKKPLPGEATRRWISIASDFHGRIGDRVCAAPSRPLSASAKELRTIACEAHARKIFTSILTPDYDRAHRDHLHVEIRPGVDWSLIL
ncbi:MAG: extensin family protein [Polyangiaceae bacterium]